MYKYIHACVYIYVCKVTFLRSIDFMVVDREIMFNDTWTIRYMFMYREALYGDPASRDLRFRVSGCCVEVLAAK